MRVHPTELWLPWEPGIKCKLRIKYGSSRLGCFHESPASEQDSTRVKVTELWLPWESGVWTLASTRDKVAELWLPWESGVWTLGSARVKVTELWLPWKFGSTKLWKKWDSSRLRTLKWLQIFFVKMWILYIVLQFFCAIFNSVCTERGRATVSLRFFSFKLFYPTLF